MTGEEQSMHGWKSAGGCCDNNSTFVITQARNCLWNETFWMQHLSQVKSWMLGNLWGFFILFYKKKKKKKKKRFSIKKWTWIFHHFFAKRQIKSFTQLKQSKRTEIFLFIVPSDWLLVFMAWPQSVRYDWVSYRMYVTLVLFVAHAAVSIMCGFWG